MLKFSTAQYVLRKKPSILYSLGKKASGMLPQSHNYNSPMQEKYTHLFHLYLETPLKTTPSHKYSLKLRKKLFPIQIERIASQPRVRESEAKRVIRLTSAHHFASANSS
ncbi:hypothetical protein CEXT_450041 [Caerostris extrusa]|uniref:Ribosomal protein S10 n=1 Tax=Caerostris extrusa TaxID=172846 RepID=A0AAV4XFL9_CAEEX|nr:hypothetical protein CEXT_450041 [Caerostris extrusa]